MLKEVKAFAFKGNVLDLAVAVILGIAFGTVVSSLVNDVRRTALGHLPSRLDGGCPCVAPGQVSRSSGWLRPAAASSAARFASPTENLCS